MGNREDLLAGALECLKTKGWTRTTVRDIASAAGVNHAAIGYHFGSREALLIEAFVQAMDTWGEQSAESRPSPPAQGAPRERYIAFFRQLIESYTANRWFWLATLEAAVQAEHSPRLRELMAKSLTQARHGLAAGLSGLFGAPYQAGQERTLGAVQLALMSGLLQQWLIDPEHAPSPEEIVDGLFRLTGAIGAEPSPNG